MDSKRCAMRVGLGLAALVCWGCNLSGQTGSPAEERPSYETPARFKAEEPGGGTNPDGPGFGSNRPTYKPKGGELLALLPSAIAVTAVSERGVLVYDVAEPTAPRLIAQLPLRGVVHQLAQDGDEDEPAITILAQETLAVDEPSVPEQSPRNTALRLIRVDLSDPTAPERVAQVDLEGDVWQFVRRGDHYLVLSEWYTPTETGCGGSVALPDWGPGTRAMRVTDYVLDGGEFALRASLELPADASFTFPVGDAFYVPTGYHSGAANGSVVSWADFSGGSLVERGPIDVEGRLIAVAREDGVIVTLAERRAPDGHVLQTWALDAQGNATARGRLLLGATMQVLELLPGAQRLLISGAAGLLVDLSDLANPRVLHQFPADVQRFASLPQGLLALGASDLGRLSASLWSVPAQGSPQVLGRFTPSWAWTSNDPGNDQFSVDREHNLLLVPINVNGPGQAPGLGVARIEADGLREHGRYALQTPSNRPISDGALAYSWSYEGLEVVPLVEGANETAPSSGFAPFYEPKTIARIDQLSSGGRELLLRERGDDGRFIVEVRHGAAAEVTTIVLDFRGDALVPVGDRVVVVGVRWDSECQYIGPEPNPEPDGAKFDRCAPYRGRGLTVIDLQGKPTVVASFALASDLDFEPIEDVTADTEWSGYVPLEDERLLFPVERWLRCSTEESCEALATPAYESFGSPGCNPQVQNCADLPKIETFNSGAKSSLMLYTLEDIAGEPSLGLATEIEGRFQLPSEGPLDVGWQLLPSDGGFAFAREEPVYNAEGNSMLNEHEDAIVRFYLDRVAIGEDGGLRALPSVNTPGRPVAWDGRHVYTVEPTYDEDGAVIVRAVRSELRDDAAHIEEHVVIGPGFLDARAVGDQLAVLRGPADPCAEDGRTDLFMIALEPGAMKKSKAIDLPTRFWSFPYGSATDIEDLLLVRGGPLFGHAHLDVDISDPAQPKVVRYTTASAQ
jgi:hypothetical protein